jgi:hypothetical protein
LTIEDASPEADNDGAGACLTFDDARELSHAGPVLAKHGLRDFCRRGLIGRENT